VCQSRSATMSKAVWRCPDGPTATDKSEPGTKASSTSTFPLNAAIIRAVSPALFFALKSLFWINALVVLASEPIAASINSVSPFVVLADQSETGASNAAIEPLPPRKANPKGVIPVPGHAELTSENGKRASAHFTCPKRAETSNAVKPLTGSRAAQSKKGTRIANALCALISAAKARIERFSAPPTGSLIGARMATASSSWRETQLIKGVIPFPHVFCVSISRAHSRASGSWASKRKAPMLPEVSSNRYKLAQSGFFMNLSPNAGFSQCEVPEPPARPPFRLRGNGLPRAHFRTRAGSAQLLHGLSPAFFWARTAERELPVAVRHEKMTDWGLCRFFLFVAFAFQRFPFSLSPHHFPFPMIPKHAAPQSPYIARQRLRDLEDDDYYEYDDSEPAASDGPGPELSAQSLFFEAASVGDIPALERLLPLCDPQAIHAPGGSYLHEHSHLDALMMAAAQGRAQAVEWLLPHCDPTVVHSSYGDALMMAVCGGHVECVKILAPVSNPNARHHGLDDSTALMIAALGDKPEHEACVEILASRWHFNAKDKDGNTLISRAVREPNIPAVARWASRVDLSSRNEQGETALYLCSLLGEPEAAKILIPLMSAHEVRLSTKRQGRSPLMAAVIHQHPDLIPLLLDKSDLAADCDKGWTALDWAFEKAETSEQLSAWRALDAFCEVAAPQDLQEALRLCPEGARQERLPRFFAKNEAQALRQAMADAARAAGQALSADTEGVFASPQSAPRARRV